MGPIDHDLPDLPGSVICGYHSIRFQREFHLKPWGAKIIWLACESWDSVFIRLSLQRGMKDIAMKHTYHALIDAKSVNKDICVDDERILSVLVSAAKLIKADILATSRYRFGQNTPDGCAVVLMLDESHMTAHSYADEGKISIDVFTCNGKNNCVIAANNIIKELSITDYKIDVIERFV